MGLLPDAALPAEPRRRRGSTSVRAVRGALDRSPRCGGLLHAFQPQVEVWFLRGTHYRKSSAALHALAAAIELATPTNEGWVVVVDPHADEVGRVYLELVKGDEAEARRGLELLKRAIG